VLQQCVAVCCCELQWCDELWRGLRVQGLGEGLGFRVLARASSTVACVCCSVLQCDACVLQSVVAGCCSNVLQRVAVSCGNVISFDKCLQCC